MAGRIVFALLLALGLAGCASQSPVCEEGARFTTCGIRFEEERGDGRPSLAALNYPVCDGAYWRFMCDDSPWIIEVAEFPSCEDGQAVCSDGEPVCLRIPCDGVEYRNQNMPTP